MGIRTRRAHRHSKTHVVGFTIAGAFGFTALLAITMAFSLQSMITTWLQDLPDYTSADAYVVAEPTTIYDADGNVLTQYYIQNRRSVSLDEISDYVKKGTVDTEDRRFYEHDGIDTQSILRAVYVQLLGGSEGASTITQQLVRNTVLSDEQFDYTLRRKVREAYIALQLEKMYSKDEILNMYLNTIYYGHSAYGIEAASVTYFNKHASELTLAEAATLVGLPQSPSYYDPTVNMEACRTRRNDVLDRMLSEGDITQEEHDSAQAEDIVLNLGEVSDGSGIGTYPFFTDYVKSILEDEFGNDTLLQGGLSVYTTISPKYQDAGQQAVDDRIASSGDDGASACLVAVDPDTGYILAMVNGAEYGYDTDAGQTVFNYCTQSQRQNGSSFKVFTLAAAINAGMSPTVYINNPSTMQVTPTWNLHNDADENLGIQNLEAVTAYSSNTGYVQIAQAIGLDNVINMAHELGVDTELPEELSVVLGSVGTPAIQMVESVATFAAGGLHRDTVAITRIVDRNGTTIYEHEDSPTRVLSTAESEAITDILKTVVNGKYGSLATGWYVAGHWSLNQPVAGKTGTSDSHNDLWFLGYTPQLAVAVWWGNPDEQVVTYYQGVQAMTPNTCQPIFVNFCNAVLAGEAREEFPTTTETVDYKANSSWHFTETDDAVNSGYYNPYATTTTTTETTTTEDTTTEDTGRESTVSEPTTTTETTTTGDTTTTTTTTTEVVPGTDTGETTTPTEGGT